MAELFRTVTLGDTLGFSVLLSLVWLVVRLEWTRTDNAKAHAAINGRLDGLAVKVDRLGEDVAFLRGRQDERDRSAP